MSQIQINQIRNYIWYYQMKSCFLAPSYVCIFVLITSLVPDNIVNEGTNVLVRSHSSYIWQRSRHFCPLLNPAPSLPCFLHQPILTEGRGIDLVRVNIFCCVLENFDNFGTCLTIYFLSQETKISLDSFRQLHNKYNLPL